VIAVSDYVLVPLIGKRGEGLFAKVSPADAPTICAFNWRLHARGYPCATIPGLPRNSRTVMLHHLLLRPIGTKMVVDHINRDRLDNRRENLRLVDRKEHRNNSMHVARPKGRLWRVHQNKSQGGWVALAKRNGEFYKIGEYDTEDAAMGAARAAVHSVPEGA
jgi:hypothetical protein